ncbi:MAG: GNAT family N-acetyltransferase [Hyphomicrobiaceae bacterium]|nr:GNAT family N-acetyltransferase [Hyphomicrobiaceae bacterium]
MIIERQQQRPGNRDGIEAGFATERLWLKPLADSDAFDFAVLGGAVEVASMTGHIPYPLTIERARQWIAEIAEDGHDRCVVSIRLRALPGMRPGGGELVGVCGYAPDYDHAGMHGIGYFIGTRHWGQGYATEAARAMIDRCFRTTASSGVRANHFAENAASARVLMKLGFTPDGPGRSWCPVHRAERDTVTYILTPPVSDGECGR